MMGWVRFERRDSGLRIFDERALRYVPAPRAYVEKRIDLAAHHRGDPRDIGEKIDPVGEDLSAA